MRTILILMDTFRRDNLKVYNPESDIITPHLDDFANDALTFDQHWIGSAPCMPARRDIFTGRMNFLERSWGPIEPYDITLPKVLDQHGIFSHITTDHCHYFRLGGEDYVQQFNTWDYHRGQEGDPYISRIDDPYMPESYYGRVRRQYQLNRTSWTNPSEYPTPKTFLSGEDWINENKNSDDFFLMIECFDPHEPFDVPKEYLDMYPKIDLDVEYFEIPNYGSDENIPEKAMNYLKNEYKALTTMNDHYFGRFIENLKDKGLYEDSLIIVTTDHGFVFGEHDFVGKNVMHLYNELAHLPLMVKFPKQQKAGERTNELTQNIDIMPTILDIFDIEINPEVRGKSWLPLLEDQTLNREGVIFGYHGQAINVTDGEHVYFRSPNKENKPLFDYTCIPTSIRQYLGKGDEDKIEMGRFIKRSKYPVYKIPTPIPGIIKDYEYGIDNINYTMLFNNLNDYKQNNNLVGKEVDIENNMIELMRRLMKEHDAPEEQYQRVRLKN